MNTPNKLTIFRFILAPVFLVFLIVNFRHNLLVALIVFIVASITDLIDGKIARKQGLVTDFGKFLDPLADKMLTTTAFLGFIELGMGYGIIWITFIVLCREFMVMSIRLLAAKDGTVIAADIFGKTKTVFQITAIIATIFFEYIINLFGLNSFAAGVLRIIYSVILWISAIMAVISGINYLKQYKCHIDSKK